MNSNRGASTMKTMPANPDLMRAMQEIRRSGRAAPHRNRKRYHRPTHRTIARGEW